MLKKITLVAVLLIFSGSIPAIWANSAKAIMEKSNLVSYYAGNDQKSRMALLVFHKSAKKPMKKIFTLLRKDITEGGKQSYYLYFSYPREIKKATFLVHKHIDEDDYRRLFLPASNTVLMIAGHQKQCAFMGSDFSAEDITGRHFQKDHHSLIKEETIAVKNGNNSDQHQSYVIQSVPIVKEDKTSKTISWIDKHSYLPIKTEFYNHENQLYKIYEVIKIKTIDGYPTVIKCRMISPLEETETILVLDLKNTKYDLGFTDDVFAEASLYSPPNVVLN